MSRRVMKLWTWGKPQLGLKKAFENTLDPVDGLLGILNGSEGGAVHCVYIVLGNYELTPFNPFQQS